MAGENDLSMDMLDFSNINLEGLQEEEHIEVEQDTTEIVTDGTQIQENVGDITDIIPEKEEEGNDPANSSDENIFKSFAGFLKDQGLLSVEFNADEIQDDDTFADLMKKQVKANEYADLTESQKFYLDNLREGIPEQVVQTYLKVNNDINSITEDDIRENSEIRKSLIVEGLKLKGFDESYALKQYNRVSAANEDVDEAIAMQKIIRQSQDDWFKDEKVKVEEQKRLQQEATQKQLDDLKNSVYNTKNFLETIPVTKGIQDKVYSLMTKPVGYTEEGKPINALMKAQLEDPIGYQTKLYYLFEITNGFKDLKVVTNKAAAKAVNTFKSKLASTNFIEQSSNNPNLQQQLETEIPIITDIID